MLYDVVTVTVTVVTVMCNVTSFLFTKSKIRKEIKRIEKNQKRKIRKT